MIQGTQTPRRTPFSLIFVGTIGVGLMAASLILWAAQDDEEEPSRESAPSSVPPEEPPSDAPAEPASPEPTDSQPLPLPNADPHAEPPPLPTTGAAADPDEQRMRTQLAGTWTQYNFGKRRLTIRDDGTATMTVEPEGVWAFLIAEKVTVQIEWELDGDVASLRSVSGEPEKGFNVICEMFGRERIRKVADLSEKRLKFLDEEDGSESEWTRVTE
ncbi:MAG: hypothetical protein ACREJB_11505 [Planctomycetaceae bacterium]